MSHPVVQVFRGKWKSAHALIWTDPACGPQSKNPTRDFPSKKSLEGVLPSRLQAAFNIASERPDFIIATPGGLRPQNRHWLSSQIKVAQKGTTNKKEFDERLVCGTYKQVAYQQRERGYAGCPDFEVCSLHSVLEFYHLTLRDREVHVGGRKTTSRLYERLTVVPPKHAVPIGHAEKVEIWKGYDVETPDSLCVSKSKNSMPQRRNEWAGRQTLVYPSRGPLFLQTLCKDLKVKLLIVMFGGDCNANISAMEVEGEKIPVLVIVNGPVHQAHNEALLDNWVLRAMATQQHPLHNEVFEAEIQEAFPSLACLPTGDEGSDGEEVEGRQDGSEAEPEDRKFDEMREKSDDA